LNGSRTISQAAAYRSTKLFRGHGARYGLLASRRRLHCLWLHAHTAGVRGVSLAFFYVALVLPAAHPRGAIYVVGSGRCVAWRCHLRACLRSGSGKARARRSAKITHSTLGHVFGASVATHLIGVRGRCSSFHFQGWLVPACSVSHAPAPEQLRSASAQRAGVRLAAASVSRLRCTHTQVQAPGGCGGQASGLGFGCGGVHCGHRRLTTHSSGRATRAAKFGR
jgi:hypothetical protein